MDSGQYKRNSTDFMGNLFELLGLLDTCRREGNFKVILLSHVERGKGVSRAVHS